MFYLNAVYKESFLCSEEEAIANAKKEATELPYLLPYNEGSVEIFIKKNNGLFSRDSLFAMTSHNGIDLPTPTRGSISTTYINIDPLLQSYGQEQVTELNNNNAGPDSDGSDGSNNVLWDARLDGIYNEFMEDTIVVARSLDDDSRKYLENGVEGVYKCSKLLNWSAFKDFCDNQKLILKEQEFAMRRF